MGWFKGLGQAATSMVGAGGGRAADAAEDPEYIKVGRVGQGATAAGRASLSIGPHGMCMWLRASCERLRWLKWLTPL